MRKLPLILIVLLGGCTGLPDGVQPVDNFELPRYLGTWYEIARLDHSFERGLVKVTATYSLRDDGGINVVNRGYSRADQTWEQAQGKAYFVDRPTTGHLKVSFFGPFYSSYVIFALDEQYRYALVSGYNREYFWILAKNPMLPPERLDALVAQASNLGFNTDELIFVEQSIPAVQADESK